MRLLHSRGWWMIGLLWFAVPIGTRFLIYRFIPGFHEYETAFIHGSDLLALVLVVLGVRYVWRGEVGSTSGWAATILAAFAGMSVVVAFTQPLALYALIRFVLYLVLAFSVAAIVRREPRALTFSVWMVALAATAQSLVAILQFGFQRAIGLRLFGESPITVFDPATSTIAVGGGALMRAYGTFPHPNILGAFLVLGLIALCVLWLRVDWQVAIHRWRHGKSYWGVVMKTLGVSIFLACCFLFVAFGLAFTFSRAGWAAAAVAAILMSLFGITRRRLWRRGASLTALLLTVFAIVTVLLFPFFYERVTLRASEPAVTDRILYYRTGVELVRQYPFLGAGIGNQVIAAASTGLFERFGIPANKPWQWQPTHNIYVLAASEIGIGGAVAFIVLLFAALGCAVRVARQGSIIAFSVACSLLVLFLVGTVDHYLWTLVSGQLMLWLTVGTALGLTQPKKR